MISPIVLVVYGIGSTQGSNNSEDRHTVAIIMFNMETSCGGKGKTLMSEEYLRRPTPTLSYLRSGCTRKGILFVGELLRSGVQ